MAVGYYHEAGDDVIVFKSKYHVVDAYMDGTGTMPVRSESSDTKRSAKRVLPDHLLN